MPTKQKDEDLKRQAAQLLGMLGGRAKSEAKTLAARENGKLGGRPRKEEKKAAPRRKRARTNAQKKAA
jgi:hypothetical protein